MAAAAAKFAPRKGAKMEVLRHNKETFREYLQFVGYSGAQVEKISGRFIKQQANKEDWLLFQQYLAGLDMKHLYDE